MSRRLLKSTAVVGGNTLISRVLGLVRDIVIARLFGAEAGTDAFFVAFKIPNFFRRLFAEGAFSQAFVPVLAEYKEKDEKGLSELIANTAGTLGGILLVLTIIAELAAPWLVILFGPGFYMEGGEKYALTVDMLRVTFPYLMLISLTALAGGVLNTFGRFAVPAFTPILLNFSMIGAAIWLAPLMDEPVKGLAWGVFAAGILQLAFQLPFLARLGLLRWPRWGRTHAGVRKIMRLMVPALVGSSVVQINLLLDTVIASFLVTGSVTWLYFADRMVEFPLGVFGIALATVILPKLSKQHAEADPEAFSRTLDWALRWVLIISLPAAVGLFVLAAPIISTLFEYEAFAASDVQMAALALMAYTIGLPAFILIKVLAPGFYARQDTKTPVKIAIRAMFANMSMNLLFVVPMVIYGVSGPHAGLALATGLAAWLNAGMLWRGLRRQNIYTPQAGWGHLALQVVLASLCMVAVLWFGVAEDSLWSAWGWYERVTQLLLWIAAAAGIYALVIWLLGLRPGALHSNR